MYRFDTAFAAPSAYDSIRFEIDPVADGPVVVYFDEVSAATDVGLAGLKPIPDEIDPWFPVFDIEDILDSCTSVSCPQGSVGNEVVEIAAQHEVNLAAQHAHHAAAMIGALEIDADAAILVTFDAGNAEAATLVADLGGVPAEVARSGIDEFVFHAAEATGLHVAHLEAGIVAERAVELAEAGATAMLDATHHDVGGGVEIGEAQLVMLGLFDA